MGCTFVSCDGAQRRGCSTRTVLVRMVDRCAATDACEGVAGNRDLSSSLAFESGIPLDGRGVGQSVDVLPYTPPLPKYKAVTGSQQLAQVRVSAC